MASNDAATESTPLIHNTPTSPPPHPPLVRPQRTVTFSPTVRTRSPPAESSFRPSSQLPPLGPHQPSQHGSTPMFSNLNSRLRSRHHIPSSPAFPPTHSAPKIGPQRTSRTAQKLKLLPDPEQAEDGSDEESGREVYAQFTRIKDPTSRRDAARLGKADRETLPRVTAYCTAASYRMDDLIRYLKSKGKTRATAPKLFDECIYTPYDYGKSKKDPQLRNISSLEDSSEHHPRIWGPRTAERRFSDGMVQMDSSDEPGSDHRGDYSSRNGGSMGASAITSSHQNRPASPDFDTEVHVPEVFLFNYGTVVIWGMTIQKERRFLKELAKFENEKLGKDDVETEEFNFYYTREYQARIYNDFISLREKKHYMTKLAISHALAQSVKTSLYEDLVDNTIETTKGIPAQIAETGKVNLTRRQINMQIGELFILRINIHLQGSVLDAPELMWAEPQLDPVYQAVRSYLEMDQRVSLLTERLDVIADLLAVLKDQLSATHGEYLEYIVIILIAAEIVVAAVNIVVDLWAGVD